MLIEVEIGEHQILFNRYAYTPASVFPSGVVKATQIRDVDPTSAPPELRLVTGETLFIPAPMSEDLQRFCEHNSIARLRRPDIWGSLLELFVDTEFDTRAVQRTREFLKPFGLTDADVESIRARFRAAMTAYNFDSMLWDGAHLGLADLLGALHGQIDGEKYRFSDEEMVETYAWAMALADRGNVGSQPLK